MYNIACSFRSTIQRRRIETPFPTRQPVTISLFQKYNPEKKDWNTTKDMEKQFCVVLSEVQSREEGLKLSDDDTYAEIIKAFRSTIQRRRIETRFVMAQLRLLDALSEVQSREEGLKLPDVSLPHKQNDSFQKYNPEKKDWNGWRALLLCLPCHLSEVQSREEGLKLRLILSCSVTISAFRSTIQRRRIETINEIQAIDPFGNFQKYKPEKKDWNTIKIWKSNFV